tara:strand:+ start:111 stop:212 length:102 start_codon:yes stop_codon:yes gene_type:complete
MTSVDGLGSSGFSLEGMQRYAVLGLNLLRWKII